MLDTQNIKILANYQQKVETKATALARHNQILQSVLFEPRNNPLFSEKGNKCADERLQCLLHQQLPTFIGGKQGLFGLTFDKVSIEKDKLIVNVNGMFESIWRLDFKTTCPFLILWDFRLDIAGLNDEFTYHGKEFAIPEGQEMSKCKQNTLKLKKEEIAKISRRMALIAFEELNLNENGTIKMDENGERIKISTVTGLAFKTGLLAIIKKVTSMQLNIYKVLLKGFPGVSDVKLEYPQLSFSYCPIQ